MAADLAATPRSGITTQVCGDAHLSNFGLFGSPERELVFDINDFDETLPGPWEWDVKRLAASLAIAGRNNGFTDAERAGHPAGVDARVPRGDVGVRRRCATSRSGTRTPQIREGLLRLREVLDKKNVKDAERIVEKAKTKDSLQAFSKLTRIVDGAAAHHQRSRRCSSPSTSSCRRRMRSGSSMAPTT